MWYTRWEQIHTGAGGGTGSGRGCVRWTEWNVCPDHVVKVQFRIVQQTTGAEATPTSISSSLSERCWRVTGNQIVLRQQRDTSGENLPSQTAPISQCQRYDWKTNACLKCHDLVFTAHDLYYSAALKDTHDACSGFPSSSLLNVNICVNVKVLQS